MPKDDNKLIESKAVEPPAIAPKDEVKPARKIFSLKGRNPKLLIAGVIAGLLVLGASASAYYSANRPANVLTKSVKKTLGVHKITAKGTLDVSGAKTASINNVRINFTTQLDLDKRATASNVEFAAAGFKLPIELRAIDKSIFLKVGDLTNIVDLLGLAAPQYAPLADSFNKNLANQWIEIDNTLLKQFKLDCVTDLPLAPSKEDIKIIIDNYKRMPFGALQNSKTEKINGRDNWRFDYLIDAQKSADYSAKLNSLPSLKKLGECTRQGDFFNTKIQKEADQTPVSIWIDKKTKLISRIEAQASEKSKSRGQNGNLAIDLTYDDFEITKPEGAKPITEALQAISGSLSGLFSN